MSQVFFRELDTTKLLMILKKTSSSIELQVLAFGYSLEN